MLWRSTHYLYCINRPLVGHVRAQALTSAQEQLAMRIIAAVRVAAEVRRDHTPLPRQCCGKRIAQLAQPFVCWQTRNLLKHWCYKINGLCTNIHLLTPLSFRRTKFPLLRLPFLFRGFRLVHLHRPAGVLPDTSDRMTATEKLPLILTSWIRPMTIYPGRAGKVIHCCPSKRPAS